MNNRNHERDVGCYNARRAAPRRENAHTHVATTPSRLQIPTFSTSPSLTAASDVRPSSAEPSTSIIRCCSSNLTTGRQWPRTAAPRADVSCASVALTSACGPASSCCTMLRCPPLAATTNVGLPRNFALTQALAYQQARSCASRVC